MEEVATVDRDDDVQGPGTPLPQDENEDPRSRLRRMPATLWDQGNEHTVYMLEGAFGTRAHLAEAWAETLVYGQHGDAGWLRVATSMVAAMGRGAP